MSKREEIGYVTVDSGLLMVGDPCYQSGDNSDFSDWGAFCDKLQKENQEEEGFILNHKNGPGKGIVVHTAFGDGIYPVYLKHDKFGNVSQLIVDLQGNYKGLAKAIVENK